MLPPAHHLHTCLFNPLLMDGSGWMGMDRPFLQVVQLEELLAIRHCVFVMGPPGAGKSQTWKVTN